MLFKHHNSCEVGTIIIIQLLLSTEEEVEILKNLLKNIQQLISKCGEIHSPNLAIDRDCYLIASELILRRGFSLLRSPLPRWLHFICKGKRAKTWGLRIMLLSPSWPLVSESHLNLKYLHNTLALRDVLHTWFSMYIIVCFTYSKDKPSIMIPDLEAVTIKTNGDYMWIRITACMVKTLEEMFRCNLISTEVKKEHFP